MTADDERRRRENAVNILLYANLPLRSYSIHEQIYDDHLRMIIIIILHLLLETKHLGDRIILIDRDLAI